MAGLKYDQDKPKFGMVLNYFSNAIAIVAKIGTYGSEKYGKEGTHWDHNWLEVQEGKERYTDALFRHYFAYAGGEWTDRESGFPHLGHMAWNVLALLELGLREGPSVLTDSSEYKGGFIEDIPLPADHVGYE